MSQRIITLTDCLNSLQGLVVDVAVVTSCRHAALSCAHRLADARPRFIGRRSVSTVLSQVCLGSQSSVSTPQEGP